MLDLDADRSSSLVAFVSLGEIDMQRSLDRPAHGVSRKIWFLMHISPQPGRQNSALWLGRRDNNVPVSADLKLCTGFLITHKDLWFQFPNSVFGIATHRLTRTIIHQPGPLAIISSRTSICKLSSDERVLTVCQQPSHCDWNPRVVSNQPCTMSRTQILLCRVICSAQLQTSSMIADPGLTSVADRAHWRQILALLECAHVTILIWGQVAYM